MTLAAVSTEQSGRAMPSAQTKMTAFIISYLRIIRCEWSIMSIESWAADCSQNHYELALWSNLHITVRLVCENDHISYLFW